VKGNDLELVDPKTSESDLRGEVNKRTHKAGYTDRDGQQMIRHEIFVGWTPGYSKNWERIFGHD